MNRQHRIDRRRFIRTTSLGIGGMIISGSSQIGCGTPQFDVIIEGGLVFDGSGKEPLRADVGIKGEVVTEIGVLKSRTAGKRISAVGMAVAPGFIDIHTHTDVELLVDPKAESKIRQGVTTEMSGQCGGSVAPLNPSMREDRSENLNKRYGLTVDWNDFDGFYRRLLAGGSALNWSTMVGQGTLREYVVGMKDRAATEEELARMQQLARNALNAGVWGISSGLEYTPGSFATSTEIARLCSIMGTGKRLSGIYATHMRNEDDQVVEAVQESLTIAQQAGVPLELSHLKAIGRRNWSKVPPLLRMIEVARDRGIRVTADRYPYSAYSTGLSALFPLWSREGGTEQFLQNLQNPDLLPKIRAEVQFKIDRLGSWEQVLISGVNEERNRWMLNKRISEIAAAKNQDPFEITRSLLIDERSRVSMCGFGMSEENTRRILKHPLVAVGSDGNSLSATGPLSQGHPHPRNFGTFPRILGKYAREEQLFPLQEAIRKMTSLPAAILGIPKRGMLKPGFFADLVIFDPDHVADRATWENPKQYPAGIPFVMVNGQFVIFEREHTGNLPGKILTRHYNFASQFPKTLSYT